MRYMPQLGTEPTAQAETELESNQRSYVVQDKALVPELPQSGQNQEF